MPSRRVRPPRTDCIMPAEGGRFGRGVRLRFPASPWEVRAALQELLERLPIAHDEADLPGRLEIVMAEVLNNVVEHAYEGAEGMIELQVSAEAGGLRCWVTDFGRPLAEGALPEARLPGAGAEGLPEGGFGWYLITTLAQDITYHRVGGENRLSFLLAAAADLRIS